MSKVLDDAVGKMVNDVFLEVCLARMMGADMVALLMAEVMIANAKHIHLHACSHQRDRRTHIFGDAGRGVERDRGPHVLNMRSATP
nr:hypothetical protein [Bradyrhizobium elkanii]